MITKEDVEHIGWLARIDINEQEKVEFMENLTQYWNTSDSLTNCQPNI